MLKRRIDIGPHKTKNAFYHIYMGLFYIHLFLLLFGKRLQLKRHAQYVNTINKTDISTYIVNSKTDIVQ